MLKNSNTTVLQERSYQGTLAGTELVSESQLWKDFLIRNQNFFYHVTYNHNFMRGLVSSGSNQSLRQLNKKLIEENEQLKLQLTKLVTKGSTRKPRSTVDYLILASDRCLCLVNKPT